MLRMRLPVLGVLRGERLIADDQRILGILLLGSLPCASKAKPTDTVGACSGDPAGVAGVMTSRPMRIMGPEIMRGCGRSLMGQTPQAVGLGTAQQPSSVCGPSGGTTR